MTDRSENPYQSPSVTSPGRVVFGRLSVSMVINVVLLVGLLIGILLSRGPMLSIFEDFGVALPTVTLFALSLWPLLAAGFLLLFTILKEFAVRTRKAARRIDVVILALTIVLCFAYLIAVLLPLVVTIKSLS